MTSTHHDKASTGSHSKASTKMNKYGITCVPVDYFHVGQYRYTHLEDAIAEAKRQLAKG